MTKMDSPEDRAKKIFGERAAMYTTSDTHTDAAVLARVVALADPDPACKVLDIATGSGHTAFAVSKRAGFVIGTDLTREMIDEAIKLREAQGIRNVEFCLANAHDLPFEDGSFDVVTCRRAAHHFSRIEAALQEMRRLLKPGGRLVIDDRSVPEDDFIDECMNRLDWYHDNSHIREYRPSEWKRMLGAAGFQVHAVEPYEKHRPLTSLTARVAGRDLELIYETLDRLTPAQREAFKLSEVNGQPFINHWFVMIGARA